MIRLLERLIVPLFFITVIVALGYWYWTTTPAYALSQIVASIKSRDTDTFERYVDIEGICDHAIDDLLDGPARRAGLFGNLDTVVGVGIIALFKPELAALARSEVLKFISTGSLGRELPEKFETASAVRVAGSASPMSSALVPGGRSDTAEAASAPAVLSVFGTPSPAGNMARFSREEKVRRELKEYGLSKEGFQGLEYLKIVDGVALVGLKFNSPRLDRSFIIELRMEDAGGYFRVTQLSNLNELVTLYIQSRGGKSFAGGRWLEDGSQAELRRGIKTRLGSLEVNAD